MEHDATEPRQETQVKSKRRLRTFTSIVIPVLSAWALLWAYERGLGSGRWRAEREHGIALPRSARNIQCRAEATLARLCGLDHGVSALFEMKRLELPDFMQSLTVFRRDCPRANWYSWWSTPPEYDRYRKTYVGDPQPLERTTCKSTVADVMEVELWRLGDDVIIVELDTTWN